MKQYILLFLIAVTIGSCVEPVTQFSKLPPGTWRAVLYLDNQPQIAASENEEVSTKFSSEGELPFLFELKYDDEDKFYIEIINGEERIRLDDISYGRDRATAKDTVIINFPVFDSYIRAIYEENIMEGRWHVNYKDNYSIPFKAFYGQNHRFTTLDSGEDQSLSGNWEVKFEPGTDDEYPAIAELKQTGSKLSGTFLTETGDYRYLEGNVIDNKMYLSTFDGAHAFLFTAKRMPDESLSGIFRSGSHYTSSWTATKNEEAEIGDAYELTKLIEGVPPLEFSFPTTDGKLVSLTNPEFEGKIKLVQIMGTWCPNCRDETNFILDYLKREQPEDIEVIAIGFERYKEESKSMESLRRFKETMNVPYTVALGGNSPNKAEASNKFPSLSGILSYPTLIFVDKENNVRKIHTGFTGPATSGYDVFVKEFDETIKSIRTES